MTLRNRFPILLAAALSLAVLAGAGAACSRGPRIKLDPESNSFFEKTRVLMTDEEARIFRGISDRQARDEFIVDFWKMRDPDPQTTVNEAKIEFEEQAAFANKWFSRFDPQRGRDVEGKSHPEDGCSSSRGQVYVLLGPPNRMTLSTSDLSGGDVRIPFFRKITDENDFASEIWHYDKLGISVFFEKTAAGRWELDPSAQVAEWLDRTKAWLLEDHYSGASTKPLAFQARYKNKALQLEIPAGGVSFDGERKSRLDVSVNVYRDGRKVGEIRETKEVDRAAEDEGKNGTVSIEIPYDPGVKGLYSFEIKVEDLQASRFSKARALVSQKIR
jgi:GWxTD domain-containing protein